MAAKPSSKDSKDKFETAEKHSMQYNTQLPHLIIPEYGRNIQKLIEYACTIKNKEERNNVAHSIIAIMGRLNPMLRDLTDFRHKLWDHLFIISDFKLDVDSPYSKPPKEILTTKPDKVAYPTKKMRFKHYGRGVERMIEKATSMKAGEEKNAFVEAIANLMKKSYLVWNRDTVSDSVILQELEDLSKGKLKVSENFRMASTNDILARTKNMNPKVDESRGGGRDRDRGRGGRHGHGGGHGRSNNSRNRNRGR
ncbi:MAG: DUF4290 domain-containing protein [Bacteroidetes bacterium]|nr:DUF4290 domain-containing protein [Bacteroidota bacterium]